MVDKYKNFSIIQINVSNTVALVFFEHPPNNSSNCLHYLSRSKIKLD